MRSFKCEKLLNWWACLPMEKKIELYLKDKQSSELIQGETTDKV
jgi:hypothetical protein